MREVICFCIGLAVGGYIMTIKSDQVCKEQLGVNLTEHKSYKGPK